VALRTTAARTYARAILEDEAGVIASLTFGPATVIRRFNVGLRRRDPAAGLGFNINPRNGYWVAAPDDDDDGGPVDPTRATPQQVVPYVVDRKETPFCSVSMAMPVIPRKWRICNTRSSEGLK